MAYYEDGYMWPQEHASYDLVHYQDLVSFSVDQSRDLDTYDAYAFSSDFHEAKFIDHYHHPDDYNYSYSNDRPEVNYFAYNYVEPKLIAHEPVACDTGYVSYHTQYSVSYSTTNSGFNEPEFEEYDPTPYGGGYDIVSVYGKPLPPSDQTCYPRSTPKPIEPKLKPNHEEPEPRPDPKSKPMPEPESVPTPIPSVEPKPEPESEPKVLEAGEVGEREREREGEGEGEREREECNYPDYGYDYPWPEYDHGYDYGVGYDYGYGKQVVQVPPCEYDPEVVDLCENIFGNWPCLARIRKQPMGNASHPGIAYPGNGHHDPWEGCADYIFGGPLVSYNHQGYGHGQEG